MRLVEKIGPGLQGLFASGWLLTTDILNARGAVEFRHLTAVTRALTGLADALLILVTFLTGRRMVSAAVGLLAAAFLALNVMHIQIAHFFTADPYLALFVALALFFMIRSVTSDHADQIEDSEYSRTGRLLHISHCSSVTCNLLLASVFIGLAVGSKFSAIMLFLPLATAVTLSQSRRRWLLLVTSALVALLVFFISNPFAILDLGCEAITPALHLGPVTIPALDWRSCYLENIFTQGAMVRGEIDLGFTRQYAGTWPYIYPIEMQLRWGMGWLLGLFAFAGFAWAVWQSIRYAAQRLNAGSEADSTAVSPQGDAALVLARLDPALLPDHRQLHRQVHALPAAAHALLNDLRRGPHLAARGIASARYLLAGFVLLVTAVYAFSFVNIYDSDHPWNIASRWVYANVKGGTLIASEQWDDSLPTSMYIDGRYRRRAEYKDEQLTWLTSPDARDTEEKLARNLDLLQRAEYVTILSNRVYGVVPRQPERYPLSSQFHQLLFDGSLGYEPVFTTTRTPHLFGLHLKPDSFIWPALQAPPFVEAYLSAMPGISGGRFDESFTVYDQPLVTIFRKVENKTAAEMAQHFSLE